LDQGEVVLCDRFYDSTTVYQGHGRGLDLTVVRAVIDFAVGTTRPDLTVLLFVPVRVSEARRAQRQDTASVQRDRMEEADRNFFIRVEQGYQALAEAEPRRVRLIDATQEISVVSASVWAGVEELLARLVPGSKECH
jgi:dTMP kinase